jgi:ATP-dependent helicase/DNAse subunit B
MPTTIKLAPAASGKTRWCIDKVRATLHAMPLSEVWVVLPDRNQASAFRRRLAESGGALGTRVVIFAELYVELVALAGKQIPVASDQIIARLTRRAIDDLAQNNRLPLYGRIHALPGFARAVADLIAEWKRAQVPPDRLRAAVAGHGQWLNELAAIYERYELELGKLGWTDPPGLAWLAIDSLASNDALANNWQLLLADGFDSFPPIALETLQLLARRVRETVITLSGDVAMSRPAYRRFARTLEQLRQALNPSVETLEPFRAAVPALAHLATGLFEQNTSPAPASANVQFLEARTPALEAREALRWLKAHIVRDGVRTDQCAIIARELSRYRPCLRGAAAEFGLPLRFLGIEPLTSNPLVAAIMDALQLPLHNWPRRGLLDALRAPYFSLEPCGLSDQDAALFDEVAHVGQIIEGLDDWREVLSELSGHTRVRAEDDEDGGVLSLPDGPEAQRLLNGLTEFVRRLTPDREGTLGTYLRWVEELVRTTTAGLGVIDRISRLGDRADRDQVALQAFGESLRVLAVTETALGERARISYEQFYSDLLGCIESAGYQPDDLKVRRQPSIYVGNLNTTRGVPYEAVAILGLSEGVFPSPVRPDPFLPDEERESLAQQGLPLEPRLRSDQQNLFYEAVTRATRFLLLARPYLADDGERWEPSPYWMEARALFGAEPRAEPRMVRSAQPRDLREACSPGELVHALIASDVLPKSYQSIEPEWLAARYAAAILRARLARVASGEFEGAAESLAGRLRHRATTKPWSASRLETYAACAYSFYTSSSLGLTVRETPAVGYQPQQLGSLLHAVLEEVFKRAGTHAELENLLSTLETVQTKLFATAPRVFGFRESPLWKAQQAELADRLRATLTALAAEQIEFRPFLLEVNFGFDPQPPLRLQTDIGPITLRGRIDRVDINQQGELRVIDYKTGARGLDPADLAEGKRLQLPLYALAAQQLSQSGQAVDGFYWPIREAKPSKLRLHDFYFEDENGRVYQGATGAMALAQEFVRTYVSRIASGQFAPAAPRGGCPPYCPAKLFCWRYTPPWNA